MYQEGASDNMNKADEEASNVEKFSRIFEFLFPKSYPFLCVPRKKSRFEIYLDSSRYPVERENLPQSWFTDQNQGS